MTFSFFLYAGDRLFNERKHVLYKSATSPETENKFSFFFYLTISSVRLLHDVFNFANWLLDPLKQAVTYRVIRT